MQIVGELMQGNHTAAVRFAIAAKAAAKRQIFDL